MTLEHSLRLGGDHGYRIDGDTAYLNADLAIPDGGPSGQWSLQLWACEQPHQSGSLSGSKVAEAPVALPSPPCAPLHRFEAEAFARIPANRREYCMVLVLASSGPGALDDVRDFANYPKRELFLVPHLDGNVGYSVEPGGVSVVLRVERILNPRPLGTQSGSLALELWALPEAYSGSESQGVVLARAELGPIAGGCAIEPLAYDVALSQPPPGQWQMALLLREWTAAGFVTRDCCNFSVPFQGMNTAPESMDTPKAVDLPKAAPVDDEIPFEERVTQPSRAHDQIALAAYYRYLARAPGSGDDALQDWLEAERALEAIAD